MSDRTRCCASCACRNLESAAFTAALLTVCCARRKGNSNRTSTSPLLTVSPTLFTISAIRACSGAKTAKSAPGRVPTTPVALMAERIVPRRTGSAVTGTLDSGSASRGADRVQAASAASAMARQNAEGFIRRMIRCNPIHGIPRCCRPSAPAEPFVEGDHARIADPEPYPVRARRRWKRADRHCRGAGAQLPEPNHDDGRWTIDDGRCMRRVFRMQPYRARDSHGDVQIIEPGEDGLKSKSSRFERQSIAPFIARSKDAAA